MNIAKNLSTNENIYYEQKVMKEFIPIQNFDCMWKKVEKYVKIIENKEEKKDEEIKCKKMKLELVNDVIWINFIFYQMLHTFWTWCRFEPT